MQNSGYVIALFEDFQDQENGYGATYSYMAAGETIDLAIKNVKIQRDADAESISETEKYFPSGPTGYALIILNLSDGTKTPKDSDEYKKVQSALW